MMEDDDEDGGFRVVGGVIMNGWDVVKEWVVGVLWERSAISRMSDAIGVCVISRGSFWWRF